MTTWKWLSRQAIEIIHNEQVAEHGGLEGLKDENALEAALARPMHKATYGEPDVYELAAAYLFGLARNHPFADGNKRTAYLAAYTFLLLHGLRIKATDAQVITFVRDVAAGEIVEEGIIRFLRDHSAPRT
ncbi:type II toxin-antitoxin system death-on-curing family toxin [Tianweitania sp. BSSL-BM11]|uniref:Type II toxin-antitoxin system death-on-curing family toxin n=1 Tax=Tianweitania aestuarii TaxID=2814886 RepID=A0ABS5RS17_9HYPH|nr:type II toxin-antitoxin system death-on-curing family toxin [Tianweitania aestuarii]